MAFPAAILASQRWWSTLSSEEQARIEALVSETQDWAVATQIAGEAQLLEKLKADGTDITQLEDPAMKQVGEQVRDAFLDRDPLVRSFYEANRK